MRSAARLRKFYPTNRVAWMDHWPPGPADRSVEVTMSTQSRTALPEPGPIDRPPRLGAAPPRAASLAEIRGRLVPGPDGLVGRPRPSLPSDPPTRADPVAEPIYGFTLR